MTTKRILVTGQVQGVGFRAFVIHAASILGLDGEVWNRVDGGVEVLVSAETQGMVDSLVARLAKGPGTVTAILVEDSTLETGQGFRIGPTR